MFGKGTTWVCCLQNSTNCGILLSWIEEYGESLENMENIENMENMDKIGNIDQTT